MKAIPINGDKTMNNGEPEIPPDNPTEVPPQKAPPDVSPDNPTEMPPQEMPPDIPAGPPVEVPEPPTNRLKM
jgi:hypothetical protein